jgi:segregation and condensation protein A
VSYRHEVNVSAAEPPVPAGNGPDRAVEPEPVDGLDPLRAESAVSGDASAASGETPALGDGAGGFRVTLNNFSGPFDLLLALIGKRKLDVTEVALHTVTDDFIAYIRAMGEDWDLDEVSEFLVVAATLLDLKAARLLPAASVEDEEDLALLEARDLLFARLLQYKAYKEASAVIAELAAGGARRFPRTVALEPRFADALPDLVLGIGPERLAALAAKALTPKVPPVVSTAHVHMVRVSVREHAAILQQKLVRLGTASFRTLCVDCQSTLEVVARFLALLELYRESFVAFEQIDALGELTVRWTGGDRSGEGGLDLDIDEYAGTPLVERDPPSAGSTVATAANDTAPADDTATNETSIDDRSPEEVNS